MKSTGPRRTFFWSYLRRDISLWTVITLLLVLFMALPIFSLLGQLWRGPGESWLHLSRYLLPRYLGNSLGLLLGTGLLTSILGVSSAWWVSRYHFPLRRPLEWLLILPLSIPSYIMAYAYSGFLDYDGPVALLLSHFREAPWKLNLMNLGGLSWVLSLALFPYVYVSARAFFLHQSFRILEASRLLGHSERATFFKLLLPLARPALVAGLILVFMEVLNDYGAARYFGVQTFTTGIFRAWYALEEPQTAVYLSALLLLLVFSLILGERFLRRRRRYSLARSAPQSRNIHSRLRPPRWGQWALTGAVSLPVLLGFVIPVFQLLWWLRHSLVQVTKAAFWNMSAASFGLAAFTAALTVLIALMLIYFSRWNRLTWVQNSVKLSVLGYAIPGAIIAIGVMMPTLSFDRFLMAQNLTSGFFLHGSFLVLVYAYAVRFLAVGYQPLESTVSKISPALADSSKMLGAGYWSTFRRVEFPLIKTGIGSAFILVFIDVLKELPLTLILKPAQINTLAVKAYEYASNEMLHEAALPALAIICVAVPPVILLNRLILKDD